MTLAPGIIPVVPNVSEPADRLRVFIVSTASPTLFGKGIRLLTGYPVSHSLLLFRMPGAFLDEPWNVAEATGQGFFPKPVRRGEMATWRTAYEILLPYAELRKVVNGMMRISGTRYDWGTIRGWIWPSIMNRITRHRGARRPEPRGDGRVYCSEAAATLLTLAGCRGLRSVEVSPGELDEDLSKSPDAREVELAALVHLVGG